MGFEKVGALPDGAVLPGGGPVSKTPFTSKVTGDLKDDPNEWYKMDSGASPQGASAWARNANKAFVGNPYKWAKFDTGTKKTSEKGRESAVVDIYVMYDDNEDTTPAAPNDATDPAPSE